MAQNTKNRMIRRVVFLGVLLAAFICTVGVRLFQFQIVEGSQSLDNAQKSMSNTVTVTAARGEIVDRYGRILATNEVVYNLVLDYNFIKSDQLNDVIYKLTLILQDEKVEWNDLLPITKEEPFAFEEDRDKDVAALKEALRLNVYATAQNCIDEAVESYDLSAYSADVRRTMIGIRYTMQYQEFSRYNRYTFANELPTNTVALIKELSRELPGVFITEEYSRKYVSGDVASAILGSVGPIYAEEYADLKAKGYSLDSIVGKSGVEKAFESYLHGVDGKETIIQSEDGSILEVKTVTEAQAGSTVMLTIDSVFQKKLQTLLADYIESYNKTDPDTLCGGGSIVVLDAKNNDVLAAATYPTYDINEYRSNYSALAADKNNPLLNRPFMGQYRPGSTFKPIVAAAALTEGIISPTSQINCTRKYTFYQSYQPTCLQNHHRGYINVVDALKWSCNIFFYDCGRQLGINRINEYAGYFGLGVDTGLEIAHANGNMSGPDYSERFGSIWYDEGNTLQAAIGQMDTNVTPLQMATEASTVANQGVRYETHIISKIVSHDYSETISQTEPVEASSFPLSDNAHKAIVKGMIGAGETISAPEYALTGLPYQVAVKTGTPQTSSTTTNSAAIAFAPVDNPEICIAIMLENGEHANYLIRQILDIYYASDSAQSYPDQTGTLLD